MNTSQGWIRVRGWRPFGAGLWLHWSLVVAVVCALALVARDPAFMGLVLAAYFMSLVVHESGHALMVRRRGHRVESLEFSLFHGCCRYVSYDASERDHFLIAAAGPLAQLALAALVFALGAIPAIREWDPFGPFYVFCGYFNTLWALMNLLPVRGFDGEQVWKRWRIYWQRPRPPERPRTSRPPLRRVK